jgi:hypothetical protein
MSKRFLVFVFLCLTGIRGFALETSLPRYVIDVNPLMWILSGVFDDNNNRSVYFDVGFQYALGEGTALKVNPAFAVGLDPLNKKENAADADVFLDIELPVGIMSFPVSDIPAFFAISLTPGVYCLFDDDGPAAKYFSMGALIEFGYQFRLSNSLAFTTSLGFSRMFPIPLSEKKDTIPRYNLYSPWTKDSWVSPRIRLALGFWR